MQEVREHLPFEYAMLGALWGMGAILALLALIFLITILRAGFTRPEDIDSPFMTPELKAKLTLRPRR